MLFLLFGSTGFGKSEALAELRRRRLPQLACHDFDEMGVPRGADLVWRQRLNERWVRAALEQQSRGLDFVLAGQTPFGELLATPSAAQLDGVASVLLDCSDQVRISRLDETASAPLPDVLSWASWMRGHAADPRWRPEVIRDGAWGRMRWERWSAWERDDPRWRVQVIDTSFLAVHAVAARLVAWIEAERSLRATEP
jgi:hypothetical protein